jgi:DNA-binding transcriptional LysR family regulator
MRCYDLGQRRVRRRLDYETMTSAKIIDMQALRIFLATAKDCNMSLAAGKLGLTQSAVSQAISQLEEQFGTKLLDRHRRPLILTNAGLALYRKGETLVNAAMNLKGSVLEASQGIQPAIRLGLVDSIAATCATPIVKKMLACVSQLTLHTGLSFELGASLLARDVDLIITTEPLYDENGLVRYKLLSERFVVITPPDVDMRIRVTGDLKALSEKLPIIRYRLRSHLGRQAESVLRRAELKIPNALEVDTADTLTAMVAGGLGWALTTPMCLLQAQEHAKGVKVHFSEPANESRSVYIVAREGEYEGLLRETFDIARGVLADECMSRLAQIHPRLPSYAELGEWAGGPCKF